jgi:hypothetical protein
MKKTIAIDFDGVLHSYKKGWTGYVPFDEPVPGAIEFLDWLFGLSRFNVAIFSSRARELEGIEGIKAWFKHHGVSEYWIKKMTITDRKPPALVYIDDRGLRFDGNFQFVKNFLNLMDSQGRVPSDERSA